MRPFVGGVNDFALHDRQGPGAADASGKGGPQRRAIVRLKMGTGTGAGARTQARETVGEPNDQA